MEMSKNKEGSALKSWARFSTIAIQMGAIIYLGNLLGVWLDEKYQKTFLESTITLLAVFLAMYVVIKGVINFTK